MSNTIEFDNRAPENLKIVALSDRAFRLWFNACCYCNRNLTDGRVPAAIIHGLSVTATKRTVAELLAAQLLKPLDAGTYLIHDYLDHNPSRADVDRERQRSRERTANWRAKQPADTPDVTRHEQHTYGVRDAYVTISDKEKVVPSRELGLATDKTLLVCDTLSAQIRERDPQAKFDPRGERTLREARLLLERDGRTVEQVTAVLAWLRTDPFWSTVILSTAKLREKFTQLVAKMDSPGPQSPSGRRETASEMLRTIQGEVA